MFHVKLGVSRRSATWIGLFQRAPDLWLFGAFGCGTDENQPAAVSGPANA